MTKTHQTDPAEIADELADEALDAATGGDGHKDWIIIQSMSSPIFRSIPEGTKGSDAATDDLSMTLNFDKG